MNIDIHADETNKEEPPTETAELTELDELKKKYNEIEDQFKRCLADYQNLQKRIQQERQNMSLYGSENVLRLLIPCFDNFNYAWKSFSNINKDNAQELNNFIDSIKNISDSILSTLQTTGFKTIEIKKADDFNANFHEAVIQMQCEDIPENKIAEVLSPGYMLHDKLLKPCQVAVSVKKDF